MEDINELLQFNMSDTFILLFMIFNHVVDDYYSQGILAKLKQKAWWRKQEEYKEMYKYDYIVALVMHAFSWAFMIMLPLALKEGFNVGGWFTVVLLINAVIHAFIDDFKANKLKINLVVDQSLHVLQICVTYILYFLITR